MNSAKCVQRQEGIAESQSNQESYNSPVSTPSSHTQFNMRTGPARPSQQQQVTAERQSNQKPYDDPFSAPSSHTHFNMQTISKKHLQQEGPRERQNVQTPYGDVFSTLTVTKGVVIYCPAARSTLDFPLFAPINVSPDEANFHDGDPQFDIPTMVGLPIWTRNYDFYHELWNGVNLKQFSDSENPTAQCLALNGNFDDPAFGTAPIPTGNTFVFRSDGLNLLSQHLETLLRFCSGLRDMVFKMNQFRGLATYPIIREKQRELFQGHATPEGFELYFWKYRAKYHGNDPAWKNLPSPYDVVALENFAPPARDSIDEGVISDRTVAPMARMIAPILTDGGTVVTRTGQDRGSIARKRKAATEERITPSRDLTGSPDHQAEEITTTIEEERVFVNKASARKRRCIVTTGKAEGDTSHGKDCGTVKSVFELQSEEVQSWQITAKQLMQQADAKAPEEGSPIRARQQTSNVTTGGQKGAAQSTVEEYLATSPKKQVSLQTIFEKDRMAVAAASPSRDLVMVKKPARESLAQRILSEDEFMEQQWLEEQFKMEDWVQGQGIDEETGLMGPVW